MVRPFLASLREMDLAKNEIWSLERKKTQMYGNHWQSADASGSNLVETYFSTWMWVMWVCAKTRRTSKPKVFPLESRKWMTADIGAFMNQWMPKQSWSKPRQFSGAGKQHWREQDVLCEESLCTQHQDVRGETGYRDEKSNLGKRVFESFKRKRKESAKRETCKLITSGWVIPIMKLFSCPLLSPWGTFSQSISHFQCRQKFQEEETYRKGWFLWVTNGRPKPRMASKTKQICQTSSMLKVTTPKTKQFCNTS